MGMSTCRLKETRDRSNALCFETCLNRDSNKTTEKNYEPIRKI